MNFLSFNFANPLSAVVNIVIIVIIVWEIIKGYKKGFLESSIKLLGGIIALILAFLFKGPLAIVMYSHLPYFKLGGIFKGVSSLNIIIYEVIAFILLFIVLKIAISLVGKITGFIEKLLSLIFIIGIPSKILGALVGLVKALVVVYFLAFGFKFACNLGNVSLEPSLADDIVELPVLKNTFGKILGSLDEIRVLAKEYEGTKDKEEFNNRVLDILLEYNIITEENLDILINNGKIDGKEAIES